VAGTNEINELGGFEIFSGKSFAMLLQTLLRFGLSAVLLCSEF
jgi:hypothetical protein